MGEHTSISELQGLRKGEDPKLDARLGNTERLSFQNKKRKKG